MGEKQIKRNLFLLALIAAFLTLNGCTTAYNIHLRVIPPGEYDISINDSVRTKTPLDGDTSISTGKVSIYSDQLLAVKKDSLIGKIKINSNDIPREQVNVYSFNSKSNGSASDDHSYDIVFLLDSSYLSMAKEPYIPKKEAKNVEAVDKQPLNSSHKTMQTENESADTIVTTKNLTELDKKHIITASLIQASNGIGFNFGIFSFPKENCLFRFGTIYELEFLHITGNSDTTQTNLVGFGAAMGLLIGSDKSPFSFLLDARIPVGTNFQGGSPGFFIGIGSSQMFVLRLGGDFRFIASCGGYEMALTGTNPLSSYVGIRFSIGLEVPD